MTMRQQWGVVLGIVLLLAVALGAGVHFLGDELFPVAVGSAAPPLQAATLDGSKRTKTLADYKGKVVLLNVWATWCEPCRVEMPSIEKLHREFGSRGLSVVAVSVDDPGAESRVLDYAKELGLTFEVLHDPERITGNNYQITGYPETFVIARDGTIRKKVIGPADWNSDANRALVRELLGIAEPVAAPGEGRDTRDSLVLDGAPQTPR
ncbi:MAG: alkyl hydroperoxide reductase/Thiol specific antioxidant/Mal allergen [Gemmatimonadetes bacterium]|nr:alkyl hydroperoxide reductase/Thiol specific antioxidant/Mal allergen [Gemmatimonadota bacterium]